MRCARCDRLAVPQAVGQSPEGLVVFGWCLDCLHEAHCTEIVPVSRGRAGRVPPPAPRLGSFSSLPASQHADRRRLGLAVASLLGTWSLILLAVGVWTIRTSPPALSSPFGNGMPILFLVGGGATAGTALLLLILVYGRSLLGSRRACRWVQSGAFLMALVILCVGIVFHHPKRSPFIVAAASVALGLSIGAHWQERRLPAAGSSRLANGSRLRRY